MLFQAASQTISRPGAMFGPVPGIQAEHYNHSNCTYVGGQPGTWRGCQNAMGISWTIAAALYGGSRLHDFDSSGFSYSLRKNSPQKQNTMTKRAFTFLVAMLLGTIAASDAAEPVDRDQASGMEPVPPANRAQGQPIKVAIAKQLRTQSTITLK